MEQRKNIFQELGDYIETKGVSWIFPNKEESLSESGFNTVSLIFLIPLFIILSVVRCIVLLFRLFISLFLNMVKEKSPKKTTAINSSILMTGVFGVLLVTIILISPRILHNSAKKRNVQLKENRELYYFEPYAMLNILPSDNTLATAFGAISGALDNDYSNREVVRLRKQLNIDDDFAKGLHFSSTNNFVQYLYSIKEIDQEVKPYINEADSICDNNNMSNFFYIAALDDFEKGYYYNSSVEMKHYFNIYGHQDYYPLAGVNNKMHLLRLLLQHQWELTTNRKFAEVSLSCINSLDSYSESYRFNDYGQLKKFSNGIPFFENISTYFEGLYLFYQKNHISALQKFESCYESTTDTILKQYCALMSIRTAFWNYDELRNGQALNLYRKIYKQYSPKVTLQYFKPDLQRYQSVVVEIINNPEYTGEI